MRKKITRYKDLLNSWATSILLENRWLFAIVLSAPIILYCLPFIATGTHLAPGDADFLMQTQEASNISILKYGQFPWWNPWVAGGVPLFANPQFGLVSLPTLFSLVFGSIIGYKLALVFYILISFWGFYALFTRVFKTPHFTASLLGYIWAFSGYFAYRIAGHYTFFTIAFFPLLVYVFLYRKKISHSWLWLGLLLGLMLNAATHYTVIMTLIVFGVIALKELLTVSELKFNSIRVSYDAKAALMLAKSAALGLSLALPKLYFSLTYISQYPRDPALFGETSIGIRNALFAMFGPLRQYNSPPHVQSWSWMEASAYIGFLTAIVALLCAVLLYTQRRSTDGTPHRLTPTFIMAFGAALFALGLGPIIGNLSPFELLSHLPIFSNMRVATRWIAWSSIMVLIFIALYNGKKHRTVINLLLFVSVYELFVTGANFMTKSYIIPDHSTPATQVIQQHRLYDTKRLGVPYDENLTDTTKSNIGQIVAGDALVDTRFNPPYGIGTVRCAVEDGSCESLVLTKNASVQQWTPNYIVLKRTGGGRVVLNMNPGRYWLVNGKYIFYNLRVSEPNRAFAIDDQTQIIVLRYQPKFSGGWLLWKITGRS